MFTALPLLVVTITTEPVAVAMVSVFSTLPWLLFALLAGALVDRLDRKRVMVVADLIRAGLVAVLGILVVTGSANLFIIYAIAFLLSSVETMFDTSGEAIIPLMVPRGTLPRANSRLQATQWVANSFVGPPVGAFLFTAVASLPFFLDSISFVLASALVAAIAGTYRAERVAPERSIWGDIGEGLEWLYNQKLLFTLSIMAGVTNLLGMGIIAVFILFIQEEIGLGNIGYGVILSVVGVGGLLGAIIAPQIIKLLGPGGTLQGIVIASGVLALILGFVSNAIAVAVIAGLYGLAITGWNVVAVSLRQELVPDELRGRVASVARLLAWGTQPIGSLLGGLIAAAFGLRAPFFVAAVAWLALAAITAPIVNNRSIAALRAEFGV